MSRNYLHIIQKAVKETALKEGAKEGARAIEDLEKAGKNLGHARKAFEHAILARSQLHTNWKQFLSDAVRLWQDYAAQLTEQERKLQEQVTMTREAFEAAKQLSAKAHQVAGAVQEIHSDEEFGEVSNAPSASAAQIAESMEGLSKSLQDLQQQAAAIAAEEELHTDGKAPTHQAQHVPRHNNEGCTWRFPRTWRCIFAFSTGWLQVTSMYFNRTTWPSSGHTLSLQNMTV